MSSLGRSLRFTLRQLSRKPGFTLTVLLTLALAVGANTAIFSLVNALWLRKLPYLHPERLGTIYAREAGLSPTDGRAALDGEEWERLRDDVPSLISAISGSGSLASGANV